MWVHSVLLVHFYNTGDNVKHPNIYYLYEYAAISRKMDGCVFCSDVSRFYNGNIRVTRNMSRVGCIMSNSAEFQMLHSYNFEENDNPTTFKTLNDIVFRFQNAHRGYDLLCSLQKYLKKANCQSFVKCMWK